MPGTPLLPILLIGFGLGLQSIINRRRFNLCNVAGLLSFSNYEIAILITLLEKVGMLIAIILIVVGMLFYCFGYSLSLFIISQT